MDVPSVTNAPRVVAIGNPAAGGKSHLAGRLTPFGHGLILAHLGDAHGVDDLSSSAAVDALVDDTAARPLVIYAALYRHAPGLTLEQATVLAAIVTVEQYGRLIGVLFARSEWGTVPRKEGAPAASSMRNRKGWSNALDWLSEQRGLDYDTLIHWSYDQIVNALYKGEPPTAEDAERVVADDGDTISHEEVVRRWEAAKAAREAAVADPEREPESEPKPAISPAVAEAIDLLEAAKYAAQFDKQGDELKEQIADVESQLDAIKDVETMLQLRECQDEAAKASGDPAPEGGV